MVEPEDLTVRRLVRALDYAEGFWLGFAKSNARAQTRRVAAACKELLDALKIRLVEIELTEPTTDLLPILQERLARELGGRVPEDAHSAEESASTNQPKLAIFVYGLEHSIPSTDAYPPVLSSFNLKRELFRREVPFPLVLWLPEYALTALARGAPDFWAWRSGLYELAPERELADQSLEAVRGEAIHITESLSERAKRERLAMLKGLLADYLELGNTTREQSAQAGILHEIGLVYEMLGELAEAKQAYKASLVISRDLADKGGEAATLHQIGMLAQYTGDLGKARGLYEESLEIKKKLGNQSGIAITLHQLGRLAEEEGDLAEARRLYEKSLEIKMKLGDQGGIASTLHQLGRLAEDEGNKAEAGRLLRESLSIFEKLGSPSAEIARRSLARVEGSEDVSE
jgi:tetratricopeptide (TPR) repeat protein